MVGRQAPSQLPSIKSYIDDYYALIINGKKKSSVPLDMGRYGEYDPHTVFGDREMRIDFSLGHAA